MGKQGTGGCRKLTMMGRHVQRNKGQEGASFAGAKADLGALTVLVTLNRRASGWWNGQGFIGFWCCAGISHVLCDAEISG